MFLHLPLLRKIFILRNCYIQETPTSHLFAAPSEDTGIPARSFPQSYRGAQGSPNPREPPAELPPYIFYHIRDDIASANFARHPRKIGSERPISATVLQLLKAYNAPGGGSRGRGASVRRCRCLPVRSLALARRGVAAFGFAPPLFAIGRRGRGTPLGFSPLSWSGFLVAALGVVSDRKSVV